MLGALIDAHRQAAIAHQHDVFERDGGRLTGELRHRSRAHLLAALCRRAAADAARGRRSERRGDDGSLSHYQNLVPGQHNGQAEEAVIVGTKNEVWTCEAIIEHGLEPLRRLEDQAGAPLRYLHPVRNPLDNATAMARVRPPDRALRRFLGNARAVAVLRDAGAAVLDVHLEDLVGDPVGTLADVCRFLDIEVDEGHLQACATVVTTLPRPRAAGVWTPEQRAALARRCARYPWFDRYDVDTGGG